MPLADKPVAIPLGTLTVTAWHDRVIDALGHDPRSAYVETFWLSILGPSTTLLLRRVASELDTHPDGFELPIDDTAKSMGLGGRGGKHSPFVRAIARCCQFDLAQMCGPEALAVRRRLPPLTRHQVARLPETLHAQHQRWQEADLRVPSVEQRRLRARRLALSLIELGEPRDLTEQQLHAWHFHPAMASEATDWAWDHHRTIPTAPASAPAPTPPGPARPPVAATPKPAA